MNCWFGSLKNANASKLVLGLLFFATALAAEDAEILNLPEYELSWAVSPAEIKLGDQLDLKIVDPKGALSPEKEQGYLITVLPGSDPLLELGWYLDPEKQISSKDLVLRVVPLKEGSVSLPSLLLQNEEGRSIGRLKSFRMEVIALKKSEAELPKILPPVELSFPKWFVGVTVAVLMVILALGVWLAIRHSRKKRARLLATPAPALPPEPEDNLALKALERLERKELWKKRQFKEHYFGVSDILKEFFDRRYRVEILEATTREMIQLLRQAGMPESTLNEVERLYFDLDLIKFTDTVPKENAPREVLSLARALIQRTRRPTHGI